jgi:hypothetical protein
MAMDRPSIFNITMNLKRHYQAIAPSAVDTLLAKDLGANILMYILRAQLSQVDMYYPGDTAEPIVGSAQSNFARLYRQYDLLYLLPRPDLGVMRSSFPLNPMPTPASIQRASHGAALHQRDI